MRARAVELAAAQEMFEEQGDLEKDENDGNLERVGGHNVVRACLPLGRTGIGSAAAAARN